MAGNIVMGFRHKERYRKKNLLFMLLINRTKNNRAYILEERLGEKSSSLDRVTHWDRQF